MRTARASKHEIVFVLVLIAIVVVGTVAYWGVGRIQDVKYQQEIAASTVVIDQGETYRASMLQFPWEGTMEVTLTRSAWYNSLDEARAAEDLGDVSSYAYEADGGYVVCEILLHSIDAVPLFYEDDQLNVSVFRLLENDGVTYITAESVWSSAPKVRDENSSIYTIEFSQGDTATVLLGFPLSEENPCDGLTLTLVSSLIRFELGLAL